MLQNIIEPLIILIVSAIVGAVLSLFQGGVTTSQKIFDGAQNAILVALVIMLYYTYAASNTLVELKDEIVKPNALTQVYEAISDELPGPYKETFVEFEATNTARLLDAAKGNIWLAGEDQVVDAWERMFLGSETAILATNYITEDFWLDDPSFEGVQRRVHDDAISRGVVIKRIFVFDNPLGNDRAEKLMGLMHEQLKFGVQVKIVEKEVFESSGVFLQQKSELGGVIDFVVFDVSVALINTHDPDTRKISSGILSNQRRRVDAAQAVFSDLWKRAVKPDEFSPDITPQ